MSGQPAAIGAWECNLANEALSWTDGVYDLFGLQRGSTIQRSSILDLYEAGSRSEMNRLRSGIIRNGGAFSLDCRIRTASNERRWMRLIVGVGHQNGRPFRIFGSKQDVTAEKGLWGDLAALSRHQPIIAPSTRRDFETRLGQALHGARFDREAFGLVIVDIDDFHDIVETFGTSASDELLTRFDERLARLFPDALASGRINRSQFALLLRMPAGQQRFAASLENARHLLCRPISRGTLVIDFTISIGAVSLEEQRHRDPATLFAEAQAALHVASMAGGATLRMFDKPLASVTSRLPAE
ncbi:diguanylate cyclase [uncultured Bosea sp.]|uniref:diguanylate cyclase domain-containing protein n=1 Tax=uncultured Bosea sp. TaxID=211457 RepID=UPI0025D723E0|nr:diguanylate cyclase [uncultured Bosea sp.]